MSKAGLLKLRLTLNKDELVSQLTEYFRTPVNVLREEALAYIGNHLEAYEDRGIEYEGSTKLTIHFVQSLCSSMANERITEEVTTYNDALYNAAPFKS
ncbi:MAG: hypothetical protein Q9204_005978 [Flavoplaca sp. TL-2023a]